MKFTKNEFADIDGRETIAAIIFIIFIVIIVIWKWDIISDAISQFNSVTKINK